MVDVTESEWSAVRPSGQARLLSAKVSSRRWGQAPLAASTAWPVAKAATVARAPAVALARAAAWAVWVWPARCVAAAWVRVARAARVAAASWVAWRMAPAVGLSLAEVGAGVNVAG